MGTEVAEFLNTTDLEFFRAKLNQIRSELLHESEETVHDMQSESSMYPDPNDRASLETERITVLRIRDRERKLLNKIEEALERIDHGTFGVCEHCESPIGRQRLDARPVTTMCIACKEEQEELEKLRKNS